MKLNDSKLFRQQALINGEWLDANNGEVIDVTNPANGDKLGSVPKMGADETRAAIDAANRALPAWRALTAKERANILRNWFNLLMEHQDDLARLMTLEQGKPLAEAKGEISYAASFIEWFAEEGKRIYGDTIPGHQADKRLIVIKQPIGVTAAITPWNFPAAMITRKAGPALAAGCTMVLKPASQTNILRNWFNLMMEHQDDLARLMTLEQGKPLAEAKGEISYAASFIEWFEEEGKRIYVDTIPGHQADKRLIVIKQPIGVTAALTPWNFPAAMITRKAGPALAAGCTMVLKPASQSPFSALALAELAIRAGVPAGVFNVVTGSEGAGGNALTSNPLAVEGALASKFRNAGQTCVCANRLYVQNGVYDRFAEKLQQAVSKLHIGNGLEKGVTIGPLIDEKAVAKVEEHIADALEKGARVVCGGKAHERGGNFFQPTILVDVPANGRSG